MTHSRLNRHFAMVISTFALSGGYVIAPNHAVAEDKKASQIADPQAGDKKADDSKSKNSALGLWELQYDNQGTQVIDRYELKSDDSGEFSGALLREGKEVSKLEDIKLDDDKVKFIAKGTTDGTDWKVDFSGTVKGDEIDGMVKITVNGQSFDLPWKPYRVKKDK